jgi:hypothetical protein
MFAHLEQIRYAKHDFVGWTGKGARDDSHVRIG